IRVREGTPKCSVVARSMARISAAVVIFTRAPSAAESGVAKRPVSFVALAGLIAGDVYFVADQLLNTAMVAPIAEVDDQTDDEPDDQPCPVDPAQLIDHVAVEDQAHDRHEGYPWRTEGSWLVRLSPPQDHDGETYDDEREQRADVHHLADVVDGSHA